MRLEVCGGESCKGTVDSRCPGGRGGGGATRHGGVGNTCTFGKSLRGGEEVGSPCEEEREWEVLGRRRGSGSSLEGGEGVGVPWEEERKWELGPCEEEREWEVLGRRRGSGRSLGGGEEVGGPWEEKREWEYLVRRRGSGSSLGGGEEVGARSLGGGEGVGGPYEEREWEVLVQLAPLMCTHCLWPTLCTHWSAAVRHHLRDTWSSPTHMGLVVTGVVAHRFCHFC